MNNKFRSTEDLTWTFDKLKSYFGNQADEIFRGIAKALGKLLVASERNFKSFYDKNVGNDFRCRNCYQTLGMDVILNSNGKPFIIEVNGNPTLR